MPLAVILGVIVAALAGGLLGRRLTDRELRRGCGVLVVLVDAGVAASVLWLDHSTIG